MVGLERKGRIGNGVNRVGRARLIKICDVQSVPKKKLFNYWY